MRSRLRWASCFASFFLFCCLIAAAQSSVPSSQDSKLDSPQTTSTESSALQTLRPLLDQALTSSEATDQHLNELKSKIDSDAQQRKREDEQRQKESAASAKAFSELSQRATRLQSYYDSVLLKLIDFSGSEEQKQAAVLKAVDDIIGDAKRLERANRGLRIGCWILGGTAAGVGAAWFINDVVIPWLKALVAK